MSESTKRYYCCDERCRWMIPEECEQFYPGWIDCTDMNDEEFLAYVKSCIK